jgi:hypothetical protein
MYSFGCKRVEGKKGRKTLRVLTSILLGARGKKLNRKYGMEILLIVAYLCPTVFAVGCPHTQHYQKWVTGNL